MPDYDKLKVKEIADLSGKYRVWKVHLLGALSINKKTGEKVIDVCLVPVADVDKFRGRKPDHELVHNFTYDFKEARVVRIGIGQLSLVRIGMFYVDGYPAEIPDFITRTFSFTVTERNQKIISPGVSWNKNEYPDPSDSSRKKVKTDYYIPARQYQMFLSSYKSVGSNAYNGMFPGKFLVVDFEPEQQPSVSLNQYPLNLKDWRAERDFGAEILKQNFDQTPQAGGFSGSYFDNRSAKVHGLIIPCVEAARFYYTKSSQSVQAIFFGWLASNPDKVFESGRTRKPGPDGSGGFLMLSRYMRDRDRGVVARYAFDSYALEQARYIYASSINNNTLSSWAVPEARFPFFDNSTDLTVHGTYLQSGDRIYFLVFWIESCTARFPFENPHFWRTNPGGRTAPQTTEDVTQDISRKTGETEIRQVERTFDDGQSQGQNENFKKSRYAEEAEMQSEDAPTRVREKINLLLQEKERFPYLQNHPIEERQPKPGKETERPVEELEPVFVGSRSQETEILGTAPRSGGKSVTASSITPEELSELDDNAWQSLYQKGIDQPDLEDLISDDKWKRDEIKDEKDEGFTKFPAPPERPESSSKLPISLTVFKEILGWMSKISPQITLRMISVPMNGEPMITNGSTTFPSLLWQRRNGKKTPELYIAEIMIDLGNGTAPVGKKYAYLMDIKATNNPDRGFQMFLCVKKRTYEKLEGEGLRQILEHCKSNDKIWLESNMGGEQARYEKFPYLARVKFKHDCYSAKTYAERLLRALEGERWLLVKS